MIAGSLELNVVQSAEESNPRLEAEAVGKLKVCVVPEETMPKSVPVVPVANVCVAPVRPFNEVMAAER